MLPKYRDIWLPLLGEVIRRNGATRPSSIDESGQTVYESLADWFELTEEARNEVIYEANGTRRSKWENMVRWARNDLIKAGKLNSPARGVWAITDAGKNYFEEYKRELAGQGILDGEQFLSPEVFRKQKERAEEIGRIGESLVMAHERRSLMKLGQEALAAKVRQVSLENVAAGYDVLSFDEMGNEKYIEVKSSVVEPLDFQLTTNELRVAKSTNESYWIYWVTNISSASPNLIKLNNPARLIEEGKLKVRAASFSVALSDEFDVESCLMYD